MQFQCTRQFWHQVRADVEVEVIESTDNPHYTVTVQKIPPGEWAGSSARAAGAGSNHGTANFDSDDVKVQSKPSTATAVPTLLLAATAYLADPDFVGGPPFGALVATGESEIALR